VGSSYWSTQIHLARNPDIQFECRSLDDGSIVGKGPEAIARKLQDRQVWGEVTPPRLEVRAVQLLSDRAALVDAESIQ
jgi:hypothetical protein